MRKTTGMAHARNGYFERPAAIDKSKKKQGDAELEFCLNCASKTCKGICEKFQKEFGKSK